MKCARCDRELKKLAITFGKYGMGRVCAAKVRLSQNAERDTKTRDWVQELAHG